MPYAPYFPDRLADLLKGWVERGGLLVAVGLCALYDKFGFDRPDLWIEALRLSAGGEQLRWASAPGPGR